MNLTSLNSMKTILCCSPQQYCFVVSWSYDYIAAAQEFIPGNIHTQKPVRIPTESSYYSHGNSHTHGTPGLFHDEASE